MPEPVLDTVVLRVMAFAHPRGIDLLLEALAVSAARFPAEVYNRDEGALPLLVADDDLSEFARGLRFARRQSRALPAAEAARYATWLANARQLEAQFAGGRLRIEPLTIEELPRREALRREHHIGRGEAACLVLAERDRTAAVFLSADGRACRVAETLGIRHSTLLDVLSGWVQRDRPEPALVESLIAGMIGARHGLSEADLAALRNPRDH